MKSTIKIELTENQFDTLAIALEFGVIYIERRLFSTIDPEYRDTLFSELQDFYNLQDYIFPSTRDIRETHRVQKNSGDAHED